MRHPGAWIGLEASKKAAPFAGLSSPVLDEAIDSLLGAGSPSAGGRYVRSLAPAGLELGFAELVRRFSRSYPWLEELCFGGAGGDAAGALRRGLFPPD